MAAYTELQVCSNYSFLRGASRVEELLLQAKAFGMEALAITDCNSLAAIARAHARVQEVGIQLVVGCRIDLADGQPVLAYPVDRAGYGRLCRLLTLGKSRGEKGTFDLGWRTWPLLPKGSCSSCCRMNPTTPWRRSWSACAVLSRVGATWR